MVRSLLSRSSLFSAGSVDRVKINRNLVLAVKSDKVNKALKRSVAGELDPVRAASRLELDGRERLNLETSRRRNVVGSGVHLGDQNLVLVSLVLLTKSVVSGSKLLAVSAPGCIELDELVLAVITDNGVKLVSDKNVDGTVLILGNGLRLDRGLDGTRAVLGNKVSDLADKVAREILKRILEVALDVLNGKCGPVLALDVERLGVCRVLDSVDPDEVELALVGLSDGLERLDLSLTVLGLGVREEIGERETGLSVAHKVLGAKLVDKRNRLGLEEVGELLLVERLALELDLGLVELTVYNKSGGSDTSGLGERGVLNNTEEVIVTEVVGNGGNSVKVGLVGRVNVGDSDDTVLALEVSKVVGSNGGKSRESLLLHVRNNAVSLSVAIVFGRGAGTEDLEGGEALDAVLSTQLVLLGAVDLGELDVFWEELGGSLFVLGSKSLAVTTPWGVELDQHQGLQ